MLFILVVHSIHGWQKNVKKSLTYFLTFISDKILISVYRHLPTIFNRFNSAEGFLFLQDDTILNYWNLLPADKTKLWITDKVLWISNISFHSIAHVFSKWFGDVIFSHAWRLRPFHGAKSYLKLPWLASLPLLVMLPRLFLSYQKKRVYFSFEKK